MDTSNLLFAFLLTLFAGLSTGIGSALAFFAKRTNTKFLSLSMGFSAGVMIYVSMVEIFAKARESLISVLGDVGGNWATVGGFFGGVFLIAIIDRLVPLRDNPHEMHKVEDIPDEIQGLDRDRLMRVGVLSAIAIAIHNFPEGLATFLSAMEDPNLGIAIAIAVAIHNIPEGIAVSIPVFYATGNRKKAFLLSFASGLAEPLGALIGFVILMHFFSDVVFGVVFASVAGIMVFISIDELLPGAREYGEHHLAVYGLIGGMMVMALSLLLVM
jgi:zinc transporter, ZIP family